MQDSIRIAVVVGALLLPMFSSALFGWLSLRSNNIDQVPNWLLWRCRMRILTMFFVPSWLSLFPYEVGANRHWLLAWPTSILFIVPFSIAIFLAEFIINSLYSKILGQRWTPTHLFRLSFWGTFSFSVPLLMVAVAFDVIIERGIIGFGWMVSAGVTSFIATLRLRSAQGIRLRPVKSGELYKRSLAMSNRMGVRIRQVCVIPFGRGRLTNAFGGWNTIAVTDDYGHWLHGAQLDFVIGHELAHVQQKHVVKKPLTIIATVAALAGLAFVVPATFANWRIPLRFVVTVVPLLAFYSASRRFEYAADRIALEAVGQREVAIQTLRNAYDHASTPTTCGIIEQVFSTHPTLARRIAEIAATSQALD